MMHQFWRVQLICSLCHTFGIAKGKLKIVLKHDVNEDECNLFLLGMSSDFVARTHHDNPTVGKLTMDKPSVYSRLQQSLVRQNSGCVVGVAPVSQVSIEICWMCMCSN